MFATPHTLIPPTSTIRSDEKDDHDNDSNGNNDDENDNDCNDDHGDHEVCRHFALLCDALLYVA